MPLYRYECPRCLGHTETFRSMSDRENGPMCSCSATEGDPRPQAQMVLMPSAPSGFPGADGWRR